MEQELNIAAILKDKPEDTSLWSPIFGNVLFTCVNNTERDSRISIVVRHNGYTEEGFFCDGRFDKDGECLLFPSKQMQDWSKFAWKKGDVLVCESDSPRIYTIFDHFTNDDYTEFYGRFNYSHEYSEDYGNTSGKTAIFKKVSDEIATRVVSSMEKHFGGKLNLETLEIEKPEPQFKDGDIVVREENIAKSYAKCILIFKAARNTDNRVGCYTFYNDYNKSVNLSNTLCKGEFRLASEEEKQQLFDALTDINKYWNAETKTLEDLPKKCEFKAFDKVVVRHGNDCYWGIDIFSNYGDEYHDEYQCLTDAYEQCLPYNEKTAHLLGTTDDWKGGEG